MNRITVPAVGALTLSPAAADEVRRPTIPSVMLGTWAETAEQCATKDKSIVSIESAKYADGGGSCAMRWVVETPSSRGTRINRKPRPLTLLFGQTATTGHRWEDSSTN